MFLSALQSYVVAIIIAVIVVQYVFALFCLLRLAYFDIDKKQYILWNLFILIIVFIGCIVFLVYYSKHPEKRLDKNIGAVVNTDTTESASDSEGSGEEKPDDETKETAENNDTNTVADNNDAHD